VLEKQVRRMLADPRSEALSSNFASQWLHLQNLKAVQPDAFVYPNFDKNLALSMQRETQLLFDSIMREDHNVLDLITAKYSYVDELLAKHYGIPNVLGSRFRKVEITDENRQGLLGQGSILTMTSISNRTSPVARGKYVMEVLLGTPPPPPPGAVPPLKEVAETGKILSVRQRMEEHRANAVCAACHKMMDPIGFALENYDGVGVWRTKDTGLPIDSSGKMFDGSRLDGPGSLRKAILNHTDAFIGTFTENLLAYATGRVLEPSDMPAVRSAEKQAARSNDRFSAFVMAVVESGPFRMRRAGAGEPSKSSSKVTESEAHVHH